MKKTIGILILCVLGITVLGGVIGVADDFYTIMGTGFFITGIWGAVLLIKDR